MIVALHAGLGALLDEGLDAVHRPPRRVRPPAAGRPRELGLPALRRRGPPAARAHHGLVARDDRRRGRGPAAAARPLRHRDRRRPRRVRRQGLAHRLHGPHGPPAQRHHAARRPRRGAAADDRARRGGRTRRRRPTTNVGRFMAAHGIDALRRSAAPARSTTRSGSGTRSSTFLGIPFADALRRRCSTSPTACRGPRWFTGGRTNLAVDLRRPLGWPSRPTREAVALGGRGRRGARPGPTPSCAAHVDGLAALLRDRGIGEGDAVGIFLPMLPETVVALPRGGQARGGLPADLLRLRRRGDRRPARRRRGQGAGHRRRLPAPGAVVPMLADGARRRRPRSARSHTLVVVPRLARLDGSAPSDAPASADLVVTCPEPVDDPFSRPCRSTASTRCSSPTRRARPVARRASVHVHGGFTVKVAEEAAFQFDCRPGDRLFWFADFGWIMGPWEIIGALANGATVCLYEGAPDYPEPDRLWAYVERHEVTILGISPTLIRALMRPRRRAGARPTTSRRCASSARPASRGTRTRGAGTSRWSAAAAARSSTSPAAPRSAPASCRPTPSRRSGRCRSAARRWAWPSTCSTTTAGRCAARSASWCAPSRGRA